MSQEFATQLLQEKPTIILIGKVSDFRGKLASLIENQELVATNSTPEEVVQQAQQPSFLQNAYKIVWIYDQNLPHTTLAKLKSVLQPFSQQLLILFPFTTGLLVEGDDLLLQEWVRDSRNTESVISNLNQEFLEARFIFLQDVLNESLLKSALHFMTAAIRRGLLVDPGITLYFQSTQAALSKLSAHIFRPHSQPSVLIQGAAIESSTVVKTILSLYSSYHQTPLKQERHPSSPIKAIPFSVPTEIAAGGVDQEITEFVRKLPEVTVPEVESPKPELPSPQQTTIRSEPVKPPTQTSPPLTTPPPTQGSGVDVVAPLSQTIQQHSDIAESSPPTSEDKVVPRQRAENTEDLNVNKELQRIFADSRRDEKVEWVKKVVKTQKKIGKKSQRKQRFFYAGLVFIGTGLGVLFLLLSFISSRWLLQRWLLARIVDLGQNREVAAQEWDRLAFITDVVALQAKSYSGVFDLATVSNAQSVSQLSQALLDSREVLEEHRAVGQRMAQAVLSDQELNDDDFNILQETAAEAYSQLSQVEAGLDQTNLSTDSLDEAEEVERFLSDLHSVRQDLARIQQLTPLLPTLLGVDEPKTYAVLLQNNHELRPTGGFIQAVAILHFAEGGLVNSQVYSSYELDEKILGEVEPPEEVRQLLGEDRWYLRDSNWDPDFPSSAQQIEWFVEQSTQTPIDGVVGINLFTLETILEEIGPLELPEYNEVLTSENLQERMEFHSEVVLVDSSGTNDYGVVVLRKILRELPNLESEKALKLVAALNQASNENNVQLALLDPEEQSTLQVLNNSGALLSPECPAQLLGEECVVSTLSQVEANVGINKANYFITRNVDHVVVLSPTQAQHSRTIVYENTAQTNAWPMGAYNAYIRFYVDANSELESIAVDGTEIPPENVRQYVSHGKKVIGIAMSVPIRAAKTLKINYSTPLPQSDSFSFAFFNQQQSGLVDNESSVSFSLAPDLSPQLIAPQATVLGDTIQFASQTTKHQFYGVAIQ